MSMTNVLTKEHLYSLQSVTNPVLAPSNDEAVFIRTTMDEQDNKYYANLFHVNLATDEVTQWTYGKERISSPLWSPDSKQVAFISNRDEKNQLYILNKSGGEAKKVTDFEAGINSFLWSPCGEKIWFTSTLKEGTTFTDKPEKEENKLPQAYVVDGMKYKMDGVGGDGLRKQNVYAQIGIITLATEQVESFTAGNYSHTLSGISHDGKQLIIGVNRSENVDYEFQNSRRERRST